MRRKKRESEKEGNGGFLSSLYTSIVHKNGRLEYEHVTS